MASNYSITQECYPGFYTIFQPNTNRIFMAKAQEDTWSEMHQFLDSLEFQTDYPTIQEDLLNFGRQSFDCKIIRSSSEYSNTRKLDQDFDTFRTEFFRTNPAIAPYENITASSFSIRELTLSNELENQGDEPSG